MAEPVTHYFPDARVFFAKVPQNFSERDSIKWITLDVSDVIQLNTTLTLANSPGTFSLTIQNKGNKYFVKDEPKDQISDIYKNEDEIRSKLMQAVEKAKLEGLSRNQMVSFYPYQHGKAWLEEEHEVIIEAWGPYPIYKTYDVSKIDSSGKHAVLNRYCYKPDRKTGKLEWRIVNKSGNTYTDTKTGKRLIVKTFKNEQFYTKYQGQLEQGKCVFEAQDLILIYLSKRFARSFTTTELTSERPKNLRNDLIRVFTGLVNHVNDQYGEDNDKIQIAGEDITKWLRLSQVNINPALGGFKELETDLVNQFKMFTKRFSGWRPDWIIRAMILGTTDKELASRGSDMDKASLTGVGTFKEANNDPSGLERLTLQQKDSYLSPPSITDALFNQSKLRIQEPPYTDKNAKDENGQVFIEWAPYNRFTQETNVQFESEYKTRRDICYDTAKTVNFEFYADTDGNINFHQPRYENYHILTAATPDVYILQDTDILSWSFLESDDDIQTHIRVTGEKDFLQGALEPKMSRVNWYQDDTLILKYGMRFMTLSQPLCKDNDDCFYYAKSIMMRLFRNRLQGEVTITGRAEITQGFPVYIPFRNMIYYTHSISHSFSFGDRFVTTLSLQYGRKPWEIAPEILDYQSGKSINITEVAERQKKRRAYTQEQDVAESGGKRFTTDLQYIMLHHTAGESEETLEGLAKYFRYEKKDDQSGKKGYAWGIGYDFVVTKLGKIAASRRWTRNKSNEYSILYDPCNPIPDPNFTAPITLLISRLYDIEEANSGIHAYAAACPTGNMNKNAVHVSIMGNYSKQPFVVGTAQYNGLMIIATALLKQFFYSKVNFNSGSKAVTTLNTTNAGVINTMKMHHDYGNTECPGTDFWKNSNKNFVQLIQNIIEFGQKDKTKYPKGVL